MVNFFSGFVVPASAKKMSEMFNVQRKLREQYPNDEDFGKARKNWLLENPMEPGTLHDLIDHIDHIARVAGVDHVGIGSDFDGVTSLPSQLDDVASYPLISQELLNRGYTAEEISKICSGNILRVMRAAEKVANAN